MRIRFTLLLCSLLFISSCNKKGDTSKEDLLTSGKWQITEYTEICYCSGSGFGTSTRDVYATYAACTKDDYFVFYKGGTVEVNEGLSKCNATNSQSHTEYWSFNSDATRISFQGKDWKIFQLNQTKFVISTVVLLGTGETITFSKF